MASEEELDATGEAGVVLGVFEIGFVEDEGGGGGEGFEELEDVGVGDGGTGGVIGVGEEDESGAGGDGAEHGVKIVGPGVVEGDFDDLAGGELGGGIVADE